MPAIDLSILNQRQTPAFYADTLANRPSAGFIGRIFVSTDTFAFYRDNGTTWDLIGGPGTGTVTGTGANGQVTYWNGASTITGNNDLFWDNVNGHLGIGTNVPGTALQIDHDQSQLIRLNQTTATNDTKIAFQNSGTALWRIGNSYNAGANDFAIFNVLTANNSLKIDVSNNITSIGAYQSDKVPTVGGTPQFVLKNGSNGTRSVLGLIGTEGTNTGSDTFLYNYLDNGTAVPVFRTTRATGNIDFAFSGSFGGKLTVSSATGDNQIQIVGATAPSLRIDNAGTGATKRAGLGISTATNNFIQGSADRDFCIFNGSTTASPILFGIYDTGLTNTQEAARISPARNFLVGGVVDSGQKLQITGTSLFTGVASFSTLVRPTSNFGSDLGSSSFKWSELWNYATYGSFVSLGTTNQSAPLVVKEQLLPGAQLFKFVGNASNGDYMRGTWVSNDLTTSLAILHVNGNVDMQFGSVANMPLIMYTNAIERLRIKQSGVINISGIPTSAAGLSSGDIYSNLGVLTIVP